MIKFLREKKINGGFTLVETLVALSIFSVSLLGIMSVLASSISDTRYAKQKIVAQYLAQEGIEYIRNMRDTYVLYTTAIPPSSSSQTGWDAFNTNLSAHSCLMVYGCYFGDLPDTAFINPLQPMIGISLAACNDPTCSNAPLFYDSTTGRYGYTVTTVNSGFTRKITVTQIGTSPSYETKITSTVYWTQGSGSHNITLSEDLFNWVE